MSREKKGKVESGQSTLEYIIIVSVVIGAIIAITGLGFKGRLINAYNALGNQMSNVLNRIHY
jgi:Flp pilus assembly pilin Flp